MGATLRLRLPVPLTADQVQGLCASLRDQLTGEAVSAVVCTLDRTVGDLTTVDAVARLALVARRAGVGFTVDGHGAGPTSLLGLTGLLAVLGGPPDDP